MNETDNATPVQIQKAIQQLYEREGLTDAMTDETAVMILSWAEQQLNSLATTDLNPATLDQAAYQLQRLLRSMNRLLARWPDQSELERVQQLLDLVEQTMKYTNSLYLSPQEEQDDQTT